MESLWVGSSQMVKRESRSGWATQFAAIAMNSAQIVLLIIGLNLHDKQCFLTRTRRLFSYFLDFRSQQIT